MSIVVVYLLIVVDLLNYVAKFNLQSTCIRGLEGWTVQFTSLLFTIVLSTKGLLFRILFCSNVGGTMASKLALTQSSSHSDDQSLLLKSYKGRGGGGRLSSVDLSASFIFCPRVQIPYKTLTLFQSIQVVDIGTKFVSRLVQRMKINENRRVVPISKNITTE